CYGFYQIYQGHHAERQRPQGPAKASLRREEEAPIRSEGCRDQPFDAGRQKEEEKVRLVGRDAARIFNFISKFRPLACSSWGLAQACACKPASNRQEFAWVDR